MNTTARLRATFGCSKTARPAAAACSIIFSEIAPCRMKERLGDKETPARRQHRRYLRAKRRGVRHLVQHPEREHEIDRPRNADPVRGAPVRLNPIGEPVPFRPVPHHLEHLGLEIGGDHLPAVADQPGKPEGSKPAARSRRPRPSYPARRTGQRASGSHERAAEGNYRKTSPPTTGRRPASAPHRGHICLLPNAPPIYLLFSN